MKYTTPVAELVALEAVSVILTSGGQVDETTTTSYCTQDCSDMTEEL